MGDRGTPTRVPPGASAREDVASGVPKTARALSTSTSSFEALDPHDPQLNHLASLMFSKSGDWVQGELEATAEEYKLLEQMNRCDNVGGRRGKNSHLLSYFLF